MMFMFAAVQAAKSLRADPTWEPKVGVLFVRIMVAPWRNEWEFCYVPDERKPDRHVAIARIRDWVGEPVNLGGSIECAKGDMDLSAAASPVIRRDAMLDDVCALFRLWNDDTSAAEWLCHVEQVDALGARSLSLLRQALQSAPRAPYRGSPKAKRVRRG